MAREYEADNDFSLIEPIAREPFASRQEGESPPSIQRIL